MVARRGRRSLGPWLLSSVVAVGSIACSGDSTLDPVEVSSVSPDEIEEGNGVSLTIVGSGFHVRLGADLDDGVVVGGDVEVSLASVVLTGAVIVSETEITVDAPASLPIGRHDVRVSFADGREGTLADGFEVFRICAEPTDCDDGDPCTTSETCVNERCDVGPDDKDLDGDGYVDDQCGGDDCDDDPDACGAGCLPGNAVADDCDGYDQDCDDSVDEDGSDVYFHDADGDGYTSMADSQVGCEDPDGSGTEWLAVATADDCADTPGADPLCGGLDGAACNPAAAEGPMGDASCSDGADNNCNGLSDSDELACSCGTDCGSCGTCCLETCPPGGCSLACDSCTCYFDCDSSPGTCATTCDNGSVCEIDCIDAADCNSTCSGSVCNIDCRDSSSCTPTCNGSSTCNIDCRGSASCSVQECKGGSTNCVVQCDGATVCEFDSGACPGGGTSCPGNVIVCGTGCP